MMTECCGTCRFWQGGPVNTAQCRRYPPPVAGAGQWPFTGQADWCGEWAAVPAPAEPSSTLEYLASEGAEPYHGAEPITIEVPKPRVGRGPYRRKPAKK